MTGIWWQLADKASSFSCGRSYLTLPKGPPAAVLTAGLMLFDAANRRESDHRPEL